MKFVRSLMLALAAVAVLASGAFSWQRIDLGVSGNCAAVNQLGQAVGSVYEYDAKYNLTIKPFLWSEQTGIEYIPELTSDAKARTYTYVTDINNNGVVTGYQSAFANNAWIYKAFVWSRQEGVTFFDNGWPTGINDLGYVCYYKYGTKGYDGRLYVAPARMSIPIGNGILYDVNNVAQAAGRIGYGLPAAGRPARWMPYEGPTEVPAFTGATWYGDTGWVSVGTSYGINDSGAIVGEQRFDYGNAHAFYWDGVGNVCVDLGASFLNNYGYDAQSRALRVNNSGLVVGWGIDGDWSYRPLVWDVSDGGTAVRLPTARSGAAYDVNDTGLVVGNSDGKAVIWKR